LRRLAIASGGVGDGYGWRGFEYGPQPQQRLRLPLAPVWQAEFASHGLIEKGFTGGAAGELRARGRSENQRVGSQPLSLFERVQGNAGIAGERRPVQRAFQMPFEQGTEVAPIQTQRGAGQCVFKQAQRGNKLRAGFVLRQAAREAHCF